MLSKLKIISSYLDKIPKYTLLPIFIGILAVILYQIWFWDSIYPGVKIAGLNVSELTQKQTEEKISNILVPTSVTLIYENQKFEIPTEELHVVYDKGETAENAFLYGRKSRPLNQVIDQWTAITKTVNLPLFYTLDEEVLESKLHEISTQISIPAIEPNVSVSGGQVIVNKGKDGQELEITQAKEDIYQNFSFNFNTPIFLKVKTLNYHLSDTEAEKLESRAKKILGKELKMSFEYQTFVYTQNELLTLLSPSEQESISITNHSGLSEDKLIDLVSDISKGVNRDPQDAKFNFENGKVKEFTPGKDGIELITDELIKEISNALKKLETTDEKSLTIQIPTKKTNPQVATNSVNNLGIKELIGRGESNYKGSISSRIHNLSLAASRINGTLIKPGEEFSFNKAVGDISALTGYEQAYVIKQGRTVLDDGGGVCQVSTTFFRAALNAGLPIIERHQHSYRVSYYERDSKPGLDAAIYLPSTDLRIKNDTAYHILIQAKNDTANTKLVFELYGTSDGRIAEVTNIKQWDNTAPPPAAYIDDPTLGAGEIKQVEKAIPGAKASFDYKVTRNGETLISKTFYSNYKAWQAVYMLGPGATPPQTQ